MEDRREENGASRDSHVDRVTVTEAAGLLGVTQSAIRKRIQRGTIPWDKDAGGRIFVYVTPSETGRDETSGAIQGQSRDELVAELRDQIDFLRGEIDRKDALLMSLMQRIPELESSAGLQKASEIVSESADKGDASPPDSQGSSPRRSWLARFFFGP
jgi:hypothetical protein